jgi:hypothetical protein
MSEMFRSLTVGEPHGEALAGDDERGSRQPENLVA